MSWLVPASADADGVLRDAIGATSAGRGGANLARADNGAVLHDNPAGILNLPDSRLLELRLDVYTFDIDYEDPENDVDESLPVAALPEFTYVHHSEDRRWAYGIGFFIPGGFGTNYHLNSPIFGRNEYDSSASLMKLLPAVAYRVSDRLSVGGTLGLAWSRVKLDAPLFVQTGSLAGTPGFLDFDADGFSPSWSVGLQYDWGETRIGLAYLSATRFDLDGDARVRVLPGGIRSDFDFDVDFKWPRSFGLGVTRPLGERHRLSGDVVWFDWSDAFDSLELNFSDASNPALATFRRDVLPLRWRDSVSFRLGYEYSGFAWGVVRIGYAFHENPVPASTLTPLIPGHFEHLVSIGASRPHGAWTWSFAFQVSFAPTQRVRSSSLVGGEYDSSRLGGVLYGLFLGATFGGGGGG